jgi:hypothetical protein
MKSFVRAMDQTGLAFWYLSEKFPGISAEKIKEDIFTGPQIHRPFRGEELTAFSVVTRRGGGMVSGL